MICRGLPYIYITLYPYKREISNSSALLDMQIVPRRIACRYIHIYILVQSVEKLVIIILSLTWAEKSQRIP